VEGGEHGEGARSRLTGASALKAHVTLVLGVALCVVAFWFELGRALGGNALSWAYVFEWPLLAGFAVYMWWKVLHPDAAPKRTKEPKAAVAPEYEGMLAAWQEHQSELAAQRAREESADSREGSE
jgi:H+/Cl- antiporter ClcA